MSNNKRNVVVDDRVKSRKGRRRYKNESLPQQQLRKEKELVKQWKAVRDDAKKTKSIVRKQAHDVSRRDKARFNETDESEYNDGGYIEDRYIWKHDGCNKECLKENCAQYILEYLCSGYD
jgi:hypothetical protein